MTHDSLPPFIPEGANILILGSLPSVMTRKIGFYYAHPSNRFYKALAGVFCEEEPKSIEERKEFLTKHHIALYDSIYSCEIKGSSDSSIRNIVSAKEILDSIRKDHPFQAVFTTGKKSYEVYRKYIGEDAILLPSPSAANASMPLEELIQAYSVILPYLYLKERA